MKTQKTKGNLYMLLVALIWGMGFVAQSAAMDSIGPFTFMSVRYLISSVVLLPVIAVFSKKGGNNETLWLGGIACGIVLFVASAFQQLGIQYTTPAKAGFITALYILIVPLLEVFRKKFPTLIVWCAVLIAVIGFYFLCISESFTLQLGDLFVLCCAVCFSFHIIIIDYFTTKVDGVKMSCIQFLVCGILSTVSMLLCETPNLSAIYSARISILYAALFSSGVGYTLQIIAQKYTDPVSSSLIGSFESVFAALFGFVFWKLGYIADGSLSLKELFGCILVFVAIILVQIPPRKKKEV